MTTNTTNYDSIANSFYLAFYGRPADPVGLKFWSQQVANANGDLSSIVEAFATQEEAQVRFGSDSAEQRITEIYHQLFNRDPEADGLSFWTNAVEKGNASMADVALAILKGAQGTDNQLADLRQQAMDKFTAQVEASGSEYEGLASIEAARVLVRAVTLDATTSDIDTLVKAAVSFADTATKTPAVVEAIATGTTLLKLYDTVRGNADPVALTQALADTAKAAAGDPVTLDSLLRGGGMDKVLKVMPAQATLHDVVDALATGGLPAAVEVVYPSTPVVVPHPPASPLSLAFDHVTQGEGDTHPSDNVTNVRTADVSFSFNHALANGQHFEASLDGKNWTTKGVELASDGKIVSVTDVDLSLGTQAGGQGIQLMSVANHSDLQTTVFLRAVDAGGTVAASASQTIVYDSYAAAPTVNIGEHIVEASNATTGGYITSDKAFTIGNVEPGAKVQYMYDFVQTSLPIGIGIPPLSMIMGSTGVWSDVAPSLGEGLNGFSVRQIDAAGNISASTHVVITVDSDKPAAPTIALDQDTGIDAHDGVTNDGTVSIGGLSTEAGSGWDYSLDGGKTWTPGDDNHGSGSALLDLSGLKYASVSLEVRQHDAAGNTSDASGPLTFTIDTSAPIGELGFIGIDGGKLGSATTDQSTADVKFSFSGDEGIVQWQLGGTADGKWTTATLDSSDGSVTISKVDLSQADQTVHLRVIDEAGNEGATFSQLIDSTVNDPVAVTFTATATETGLSLHSSVAAMVSILSTDGGTNLAVVTADASTNAVVGDTTLGAQSSRVSGTLLLHPAIGDPVADSSGLTYTLGSNGAESLTGSYVWGFDGKDTITGTSGSDHLYGGAGDDFIFSAGGADVIVGGTGGDTILLTNDGIASTVVVHAGDTATGVVVNGASIEGMDAIATMEKGDVIQLDHVFSAAPDNVQTSFLTSTDANQVAIIAGSNFNHVFDTTNPDGTYMIQWSDGVTVNSILVRGYFDDGVEAAPTLEINYETGTLTLATLVGQSGGDSGDGGMGIPGG